MTRPINLLYMIPSFGTGGTERLVIDLVTHLDPDRFSASVCVQQDGLMSEALAGRGYTLHMMADSCRNRHWGAMGKLQSMAVRVKCLQRLLAQEQIDILHTHHLGPLLHAYLAGFRSRNWKWVHTEHVRPELDEGYSTWLQWVTRRMFASADMVTGVSDAVGGYFHECNRIPSERVRVIYNGVDVDRFAGPYDSDAKRREIGIPPQAWVIGLVANLRPQKNHALLLRAFSRLAPEVPEARLVFVGDGKLAGSLRVLADNLKIGQRVHFLGARLDAPELFATFDVYCLPSHYEGMPLTVFEAMAAGKPVVATKVIGIQEVIADGQTGILVPSDDADSLAQALMRLRSDPHLSQQLARAGSQFVNSGARLEHMVERYAALYEQVLKSGVS